MRAAIAIAVLAGLAGWWPAMADEASRSYAEAPAAMQAKVIKVLEFRAASRFPGRSAATTAW